MVYRFISGEETFRGLEKKERDAILHLLGREAVNITEDIRLTLNVDLLKNTEDLNPNEYPGTIYIGTKENHIVYLNVFNCLRRLGSLPEEFGELEKLTNLSMDSTAGFMMLVNTDLCKSLKRLKLCRTPLIKFYGKNPNTNITHLGLISCGLDKISDMQYTPNVVELDLRYNRFREIPTVDDLAYLKQIDLRKNPIKRFSLHNYANTQRLRERGVSLFK